jgi:hypothetical protein
MLAGALFQTGSLPGKFFFPVRLFQRLQAATHDEKKQ